MNAPERDALDIILLVGSILALGISIMAAGSMAIIAGVNNFLQLVENAEAAWTIAVIFGSMGLLTIPGLYLSYRSVNGQAPLFSNSISPLLFTIGVGFPFSLALGALSREFNILPSFLEPIAHVIAATTPMLFMSLYVVRTLPVIPWRRIWGYFSGGLWASPLLALLLELLTAIPLVLLLLAYVWTEVDPSELLEPLRSTSPLGEAQLNQQIEAFLQQPLLILGVVLFVAVFVPLLEELIKSIAIWPTLNRGLTPLYAFAGGAVAGGAYGIFEAFFLAQPGQEWASLMIARAGATFMHMLTTGIVSSGLARGLKSKKWGLALRHYLSAVALHGLWNLAALGVGLGLLSQETGVRLAGNSSITLVVIGSGVVLALLALGAVFGLHTYPRYLLKQKIQTAQEASAGVS